METTYYQPGRGYPTPWGPAQTRTRYSEHISAYTTSSHGGIKVNASANKQIHPAWRSPDGFYEEDVEWAIVAFTFPDVVTGVARAEVEQTLKDWWPHEYMAVTGTTLTPEDSSSLREELFRTTHHSDYVVVSAWGDWADWVPAGMVGVATRRESDGDERRFLIEQSEYESRDDRFVIDETRHRAA